jgi:hypothetical protein
MAVNPFRKQLGVVWQRSMLVALLLWLLISAAALALCHGTMPLAIGPHPQPPVVFVIASAIGLVFMVLEILLLALLFRKRPVPDIAARAPERGKAWRETLALWAYGAAVMLAGRWIGLHFFGEGIGLHLNGSLVGASRVQSPREVYAWAAYNGFFLALLPYMVFRARGYTNRQLNLKSENWRSDTLLILLVLAIGVFMDLTFGTAFRSLDAHQQLVGGTMSFLFHLAGTDLPIMIFIYAILAPRYARLYSQATAYLVAAATYPAMHIFESWTRYDSVGHAALSVIAVFLVLFPAGLMKSFLTMRTGNAWVHMWGFHAISPHVTVDTRLIVKDFGIR